MRRYAVRSGAVALLALELLAPRARAQGFGVYEQDACTMARAGTGVAKPCNASAIFFNPAGIVTRSDTRWNLSLGGTLISPTFTYRDSLTGQTTNGVTNHVPVPNLYLTRQRRTGDVNWAWGVGLFAPYGLVSQWPTTFAGRFLGYRSELKSLYLQPTVAVEVNRWLKIGAGFDYIWTHVDLRQRVDLSGQPTATAPGAPTFGQIGIPLGTDFADGHLVGDGYSAGGHFGILLQPLERLSIGARYLMRVHASVQGTASFSQVYTGITLPPGNPIAPAGTPLDTVLSQNFFATGKPLAQQHVSTIVAQPDQLVVGAALNLTPELTALADWQWTSWRQFQTLVITFQNLPQVTQYEDYRNTNDWRFGLQYDGPAVTLRGGYLFHDGAAPDATVTPLLPEGRRAEYTVGAGFRIGARGRLDVAYQYITQQDRRGRVVAAPRYSTAFNTGLYTGKATLLSAGLSWGF